MGGLGEELQGLQVPINGKGRGSRQGATPGMKIRSLDGKGLLRNIICVLYTCICIFGGINTNININ